MARPHVLNNISGLPKRGVTLPIWCRHDVGGDCGVSKTTRVEAGRYHTKCGRWEIRSVERGWILFEREHSDDVMSDDEGYRGHFGSKGACLERVADEAR